LRTIKHYQTAGVEVHQDCADQNHSFQEAMARVTVAAKHMPMKVKLQQKTLSMPSLRKTL
jgi:hypothetical protein